MTKTNVIQIKNSHVASETVSGFRDLLKKSNMAAMFDSRLNEHNLTRYSDYTN